MLCKIQNNMQLFFAQAQNALLGIISYALIIPFFIFIFFAQVKRNSIGTLCIADFINALDSGSFMNFLLIPLAVAIIIIICKPDNFANIVIKSKSRKILMITQYKKLLIVAGIFVIYCMVVAILIAGLFAPIFINWTDITSHFYMAYEYTFDISFFSVTCLVGVKIYFLFVFFSSIILSLNLIMKRIYCFLIVLLFIALDVLKFLEIQLCFLFGLNLELQVFMSMQSKLVFFIVVPTMILLTIALGLKLVDRKDFLES